MRTSCLIEPANVRFIVLRDDFRDICGGECGGALLAVMRYLADKYDETTWVEHSTSDFVDDIRGLYSKNVVRESLAEMVAKGYLERRDEDGKRTLWRLRVDAVNEALAAWSPVQNWIGTPPKLDRTPTKTGGVSENTPYTSNRKIEKEEEALPDDDPLKPEMYGDGWVVNRCAELNTRLTMTTKLRGNLRRELDGDMERRSEVNDLLIRFSGGDVTADLKRLIEGYEKGWKPRKKQSRQQPSGDSSVNSTKPRYDKYAIAAEVIANFTEDDLK